MTSRPARSATATPPRSSTPIVGPVVALLLFGGLMYSVATGSDPKAPLAFAGLALAVAVLAAVLRLFRISDDIRRMREIMEEERESR